VVELDHVLIAVSDLPGAGRRMESLFGVASVAGGRHPGWGTANRIIPLGDAYLELVTVVDSEAATASPFGWWVCRACESAPAFMGWAVRTQDLDRIAKRLDLTPDEGSRAGQDGALIRWRMAGVQQAAAEPLLPFFIEWGQDTRLPWRAQVSHPAGAVSIEKVLVRGNEQRMDAWLGGDTLPLEVTAGAPAVVGLVLSVAGGAIHVGPDL
jgi:hypothetical protein